MQIYLDYLMQFIQANSVLSIGIGVVITITLVITISVISKKNKVTVKNSTVTAPIIQGDNISNTTNNNSNNITNNNSNNSDKK